MTARRLSRRTSRAAFGAIQLAAGAVFFWVFAHHVVTADFKPLAALCVPILGVFFGFTALLYNRGRALMKGPSSIRSLYAAERALQGTVWYLAGIIVGVSLYGVLMRFSMIVRLEDAPAAGLWLLLFMLPFLLMQAGLIQVLRAAWLVAPHVLRQASAREIRRRIP